MKKVFFLPIIFMALLSVSGCQTEDSLDPRPVIVNGQYVRLDITNKVLTFEHMETAVFGGQLTAPGNNVKKFELYVRRTSNSGVTAGNYKKINLDVQSFPYDLKITPQILADALEIPVAELQVNDKYNFLGYSYGFDGTEIGYNNLSSTVKTAPGMKQAYKFVTTFLTDQKITAFTSNGILIYDNYQ